MSDVTYLCCEKNNPLICDNVICVEGNIGSGKSTLLKKLYGLGFTVIAEPVEQVWGEYLPQLYKDPKRWGMSFQMEAIDWFRQLYPFNHERFSDENLWSGGQAQISPQQLEHLQQNYNLCELQEKFIIVERSALSAFEIFARNLVSSGCMTEWEFSLLRRFYNLIQWHPRHILYLQCDPEISLHRIQERNRDGEDRVERELVHNLHNLHESTFITNRKKMLYPGIDVISVDASGSPSDVLLETVQRISDVSGLTSRDNKNQSDLNSKRKTKSLVTDRMRNYRCSWS